MPVERQVTPRQVQEIKKRIAAGTQDPLDPRTMKGLESMLSQHIGLDKGDNPLKSVTFYGIEAGEPGDAQNPPGTTGTTAPTTAATPSVPAATQAAQWPGTTYQGDILSASPAPTLGGIWGDTTAAEGTTADIPQLQPLPPLPQELYKPRVSAEGEVQQFTPQGFATYDELGNPTLESYSQPVNLAPGQAFPSSEQAQAAGGVTPGGGQGTSTYSNLPFVAGGTLGTAEFPGVGDAPGFSFDFASEQLEAYNKLYPFYKKIVEFAKGDINLAKRILKYTYDVGMRETMQQYRTERRKMMIENPLQREQMSTEQNRRGVLGAGFGETNRKRLLESQNIRRESVDRAKETSMSRLGANRGFGLEKEQKCFQRELFDTERERRQESKGLAQDKYQIKQAEYTANLQKYMFEKQQEATGQSL